MTPFLLIPGLNCDARVYAPASTVLWQFGSVTIANHLSGEGVAAIAADILADAPPRFALGGFSMGGYLALEIMRQAPERVARLALINTQARPDTSDATERRRGLMARAKSGGYRDVLDEMFPGLVHPSRDDDQSLRRLVHDMGEDVGIDAFLRQQAAVISRPDSRPALAWIKCPTLVLSGDQDNTISNSLSIEMASNIPDAKLVILPHCGHLPQPEQPEATAAALVEWLQA